jgi:AcrR family transcriptional regulator
MNALASPARQTADERRQEIVAAAVAEFAAHGLSGANVQAIARRVGVSQPYVFQLFGTKKDLFLAVVREGFTRTRVAFEDAASRQRAGQYENCNSVLMAMGLRYKELLHDRTLLLVQLQAYAACDDADVREVVRHEWHELHRFVAEVSGASPQEVFEFFSIGMLLNVGAAIQLEGEPETWTLDAFAAITVETQGERPSTS